MSAPRGPPNGVFPWTPLHPDGTPVPLYDGELFTQTFPALRFHVSAGSGHALGCFGGHGSAFLSQTRLVFSLIPKPHLAAEHGDEDENEDDSVSPDDASSDADTTVQSDSASSTSADDSSSTARAAQETTTEATPTALSIPLAWIRRDRLSVRRPLFDTRHLAGSIIPTTTGLPQQAALLSVIGHTGRPIEFRIETLEDGMDTEIHNTLLHLLSDPEKIALESRRLRSASDSMLVPTDVHYAFVDPECPSMLVLATHMTVPPRE